MKGYEGTGVSTIIDAGGPSDRKALKLSTRRGNHIRNERRREWHPDRLRRSVQVWANERPYAALRSISAVYNCSGLVFATRRTWIDNEEWPQIRDEDEYRPVTGLNQAQVADVVVYRGGSENSVTHVGLVIGKKLDVERAVWEITVLSKWGPQGEYSHRVDYLPDLLGRPTEYWTDRRSLP